MTPPAPTLPQTIALLAMSRGGSSTTLAPMSRTTMRRHGWIAPDSARGHVVTEAGRAALGASPHLERAQRELDRGVPPVRSLTGTTGVQLAGTTTAGTKRENTRRATIVAAAIARGGGR